MQNSLSTSPLTLVSLIQAQQAALAISDRDLCAAIGFEREIALTLIKAGTMRLPLTKVPAVAAALGLDAAELLRVALHESDPVLAKLIEQVFNPLSLSANEVAQITHQRERSGDAPGVPIEFDRKEVATLAAVSA